MNENEVAETGFQSEWGPYGLVILVVAVLIIVSIIAIRWGSSKNKKG